MIVVYDRVEILKFLIGIEFERKKYFYGVGLIDVLVYFIYFFNMWI